MKELSYMAIRLKEARKKAGMGAAEAGECVNRSESTIYAWENATAEPSAEQLVLLCRAYGVDIAYFYPPEALGDEQMTAAERKIVDAYRKLSDDDKAVLCGILMVLAKR